MQPSPDLPFGLWPDFSVLVWLAAVLGSAYLVFLFSSEQLNPFSLPRTWRLRRRWHLGRGLGLATLVATAVFFGLIATGQIWQAAAVPSVTAGAAMSWRYVRRFNSRNLWVNGSAELNADRLQQLPVGVRNSLTGDAVEGSEHDLPGDQLVVAEDASKRSRIRRNHAVSSAGSAVTSRSSDPAHPLTEAAAPSPRTSDEPDRAVNPRKGVVT